MAVAVPECRPGLWVRDLNLKFKGNGKILVFKQNVAFFKVGPKKNQVTCFKSEHSGSKGVPGSGSHRASAQSPGGQGSRGQGCPGNLHRTTSGQAWALRSTEGQHLTLSMLQSVSRNLSSKSIPLVHPGSFCGGGHHSPLCTSLPGGQHCPHPSSVQGGFQGGGVAGTAWSWPLSLGQLWRDGRQLARQVQEPRDSGRSGGHANL